MKRQRSLMPDVDVISVLGSDEEEEVEGVNQDVKKASAVR